MQFSFEIKNFINNSFTDPQSNLYLNNYEPATGQIYSQIPDSNADDVQLAVESAKQGFSVWSKMTKEERSRIMIRIADLIEENLDTFAEAESRDTGKPVSLAKRVDIPRAVLNMRYFAGAILHHEEMSSEIDGRCVNYSVSQPIGVCGLISPWNLPLYLMTWKIAPAICVGNSIVAKPSEITSMTAHLFAQVSLEAGIPPGVINFVYGYGHKAGAAIVEHPDVPLLSFTGGTATAEHIIKASAPHYKKLGLELGGKNPNIVFDDCNIEKCVRVSILSSFANQGEICLCAERILVQRGIYDEFVQKFVEATKKLVIGDPNDPETTTGALVSEVHMNKVLEYINIAKDIGGKIETGGERVVVEGRCENGYFVAPTVITGLTNDCRVCQEEVFGPFVTIVPFDTEEEAIEMANNVQYGLASCVWTENLGRAHRVSLALQTGTVWVNCFLERDLRVPFGGWKASGIGREGGRHSIEFYTEQKTVCMNYLPN